MNETVEKKRKVETGKFDFNPVKILAKGQYGNLYLAYSKSIKFIAVIKSFKK